MVPLEQEFGWPRALMSTAVSLNLVLYGLIAPFAAALMDRFGIRWVTSLALVLVAAGSGLTIVIPQGWQLMIAWGLLIGLGTGSMAMVFAATIADRWFVRRRGLVMGLLTAAGATGQLIFLPVIAALTERQSWRRPRWSSPSPRWPSSRSWWRCSATIPRIGALPRTALRRAGRNRRRSTQPEPRAGRCARPGRRGTDQDLRGPSRWLRDLRRYHQGPNRYRLRASAHDHGMRETTAAGLQNTR
jgi:MFS family permease